MCHFWWKFHFRCREGPAARGRSGSLEGTDGHHNFNNFQDPPQWALGHLILKRSLRLLEWSEICRKFHQWKVCRVENLRFRSPAAENISVATQKMFIYAQKMHLTIRIVPVEQMVRAWDKYAIGFGFDPRLVQLLFVAA